eukprot:GHVT01059633.1.p1 GENE.GHVT01059633.1~~GHVT01059633.1.p1  ORF type:complete len:221 (+),score=17.96 GHVT01059633.1:2695-3357(+)
MSISVKKIFLLSANFSIYKINSIVAFQTKMMRQILPAGLYAGVRQANGRLRAHQLIMLCIIFLSTFPLSSGLRSDSDDDDFEIIEESQAIPNCNIGTTAEISLDNGVITITEDKKVIKIKYSVEPFAEAETFYKKGESLQICQAYEPCLLTNEQQNTLQIIQPQHTFKFGNIKNQNDATNNSKKYFGLPRVYAKLSSPTVSDLVRSRHTARQCTHANVGR